MVPLALAAFVRAYLVGVTALAVSATSPNANTDNIFFIFVII
jgi:hypothetical protein